MQISVQYDYMTPSQPVPTNAKLEEMFDNQGEVGGGGGGYDVLI